MSEKYYVSSSPHIRHKDTTSHIMILVIVALLPSCLFGIYNFGYKAVILMGAVVATAVLSEYLFNLILHKKQTIGDFSAVVTGLLLAMNLPVELPVWQGMLGAIFAIIVVKCLFGGLGQNFMNPALAGRCFLLIAFAANMTNFTCDSYSGATPLALMREQGGIIPENIKMMDLFIGNTAGTIGETSALAILIGALILVIFGVIDLKIPFSYIISFVLFMVIFGPSHNFNYIIAQLCSGGLMLGAFFMATDYVTSPITPLGKILFGISCGVLTGLFRCFGANAEGVSFAIILSNLFVPIIEKYTVPRAFGVQKVKEDKKHE